MSKNQQEQSKPTFLTVVEIPQHKASIYVTNEQIVVQDFENKKNGLVISWQAFKEHGLLPESSEDNASDEEAVNSSKRTIDFVGEE